MKFNIHQVEQLIYQKLAGSITDEDNITLLSLMEEYPQVKELLDKRTKAIYDPKISAWLDAGPSEKLVEQIFEERKPRQTFPIYKVAVAAAVAGLIIGAFALYNRKSIPTQNESLVQQSNSPDAVELVLENGKRVNLTERKGNVSVGAATFSNASDSFRILSSDLKGSNEIATILVPAGKDYKIELPDGSWVHLNSGSRLQFPVAFSSKERSISLFGEALLTVAPKSNSPFVVTTPLSKVEVLGTSFNINTYNSAQETVSLLSGSVRIGSSKGSMVLKPGQEAVITEKNALAVRSFSQYRVLGWQSGLYFFNHASLVEIGKDLQRVFPGIKSIVVQNREVDALRFSGTLDKSKSIEENLNILNAFGEFSYKIIEGNIIVK